MNYLFEEAGLIPPGSARNINSDLYRRLYRFRDEVYAAAGIHLTNVFNIHPPGNKIAALCQKEKVGGLPGIKGGQYVREQHFGQLDRLRAELQSIHQILSSGSELPPPGSSWALEVSQRLEALSHVSITASVYLRSTQRT
jgi:hypothetical protein